MAAYRGIWKIKALLLFPKLGSSKKAATITVTYERQMMKNDINSGVENNPSKVYSSWLPSFEKIHQATYVKWMMIFVIGNLSWNGLLADWTDDSISVLLVKVFSSPPRVHGHGTKRANQTVSLTTVTEAVNKIGIFLWIFPKPPKFT